MWIKILAKKLETEEKTELFYFDDVINDVLNEKKNDKNEKKKNINDVINWGIRYNESSNVWSKLYSYGHEPNCTKKIYSKPNPEENLYIS